MPQKSSFTRYILIREIYLSKKLFFAKVYSRKSDKSIYFVYILFCELIKNIYLVRIYFWKNGKSSHNSRWFLRSRKIPCSSSNMPIFEYCLPIKILNSSIRMSSCVINTAWKVSVFGIILVRIFPHSDWIRRDTPYLFVFRPNAGKYGPVKHLIRTLFTQWKERSLVSWVLA